MHVEVIGSTSAGKTTLSKQLVCAGKSLGVRVSLSDDFILRRFFLNRVRNEFIRRRLIESLAALAVACCWWRYRHFLLFAVHTSFRCGGSLWYRAAVARIVVKKIGIRAIIRQLAASDEIVLADNEGVIQAAHTLFVHKDAREVCDTQANLRTAGRQPTEEALSRFIQLAPLPDVVVYMRQPEHVLIERTSNRGHGRLRTSSGDMVASFVKQAQEVFEYLHKHPSIAGKLVVIDAESNTVSASSPAVTGEGMHLAMAQSLISAAEEGRQAPQLRVEPPVNGNGVLCGKTIAVVGADAAGKSTLVDALAHWLNNTVEVKKVHVGKPPATWLTLPLNLALRTRRLLIGLRKMRSDLSARSCEKKAVAHEPNPSLLYAVRAVGLAWDRRRLLLRAKRQAAKGHIVVCDRYPTEIVGAMDSPRLSIPPDARGWKNRLCSFLARIERRLYREMPPPDLTLRLHVSLETARQRNHQRSEQDEEEYLETRHRQQISWFKSGTSHIVDIDAEQSSEQMTLAAKRAIARTL